MAMLTPTAGGIRIAIRLAPKASRDQVVGEHDGALKIAITAPPVDGKANTHLIKFLSKRLKVAKGAIRIVSGELNRNKLLEIDGIAEADVRARLL